MKGLRGRIASTIAAVSIVGLLLAAKIAPFADDVARAVAVNSDDALRYASGAKADEAAEGLVSYSRDLFGYTTKTRHETLQLHVLDAGTAVIDGGRVTQGIWRDAYTAQAISNVTDVSVDHIVPLRWAWDHGARNWPNHLLNQFGNDAENLVVTASKVNSRKGSAGPGDWSPPDPQAASILEARQKWIVKKYGLNIDE